MKRNRLKKNSTIKEGIIYMESRRASLERSRYGGQARKVNFMIALTALLQHMEDPHIDNIGE